jgi:two-component system, NarL family, invasion response regulator UvrY
MDEKQALIVDDHPVIRESLKQVLQQTFPPLLIRDSPGTEDVLEEICPWTFVTLDINMPGENGLNIVRKVQGCCPHTPIVVFSLFPEDQYTSRALRAGAAAYVSKTRSVLELVQVIKSVLRGEKKSGEPITQFALSTRETEVLRLLAKGLDREEIATSLGIHEKTVSTYRTRLLQKLGARTTVDLVRYALEEGLLE